MQIFLCWSGKASLAVAQAMRTFLGDTIQELKPFLSSEDIRKGGRWNNEIGARLAECNFGILCMTKDNLDARWILFEAGALAKLPTSNVTAILAGIQSTDVRDPLSQFQHTSVSQPEIFKLLEDINALLPEGKRLDAGRFKRAFDHNWPTLEKAIGDALKLKSPDDPAAVPARTTASMVTELLELVREMKREAEVAKGIAATWTTGSPQGALSSIPPVLPPGAMTSIFPARDPPPASVLSSPDRYPAATSPLTISPLTMTPLNNPSGYQERKRRRRKKT